MSAGGGKEIHYDSSAMRAQYDQGGGMDVADSAYVPPIAEPTPQALAETLPKDVLEAMARGGAPSPESIRKMAMNLPAATAAAHQAAPQLFKPSEQVAVELTIPVGRGMTARVTFNAQPTSRHWQRLLKHLEIEADPENDEEQGSDLSRLADEALAHAAAIEQTQFRRRERDAIDLRAGNGSGEPIVSRPAKRRKRKDDGGVAGPQ